MKHIYQPASINVILLDQEDIISTSGLLVYNENNANGAGGNEDVWNWQ